MAFRLTLKPGERVIIGGAVIRNGRSRVALLIENEIPLLREADIMSPSAAQTPCGRIVLALQLMYVDGARATEHHHTYLALAGDLRAAAPSLRGHLAAVDEQIGAGRLYHALKCARLLLQREHELMTHVQ